MAQAKKGKTGLDEKKDWRPKAEREKLTLERKRLRQEKMAADGAPPAVPAAPTPVAAAGNKKKKVRFRHAVRSQYCFVTRTFSQAPAKGRGKKKQEEAKEDGSADGTTGAANGDKTSADVVEAKMEEVAEDGASAKKRKTAARKGAGKKK